MPSEAISRSCSASSPTRSPCPRSSLRRTASASAPAEQSRPLKLAVGIALQPRIARSGALTPEVAAGALSVGIVVVARSVWGSDDALERALLLVVMLLAASIGSALDDPTEPTVGSAPIPLRARRTIRLLPAAMVAALSWAVSVAIAGGFAAGSLTLMLAGLAVTGTAVAALAAHAAPQRAGVAGAGFVLAAALVITRLPDRWSMLPDPSTGLDQPAKLRWAVTIVIGLAILIHTSRDPGRARTRRDPAQIEPRHASPAKVLMLSPRKMINDLEPDAEHLEPASAIPRRRQQPERRTHVDGLGDAGTQLLLCGQVTQLFHAIDRPLDGSHEFDKPGDC